MSISVSYGSYNFGDIGNQPSLTFNTEINRTNAGYISSVIDKIQIKGVIYGTGALNNSGNANNKTQGAWVKIAENITGLRDAFAKSYESLKISCGNSIIYQSNPSGTIIDSIAFDNQTNENWLQAVDYDITLSVYNTGYLNYGVSDTGFFIKDFEDTYSIQTNSDESYYRSLSSSTDSNNYPRSIQTEILPTYTINRTVSANGINTNKGASDALNNAKKFVSGLVNNNPKIYNILNNLSIYDRTTTVSSDLLAGKYSIKDTFVAISGLAPLPWTDTFTVSSDIGDNLQRTVTVDGTIKGVNSSAGLPVSYENILKEGFIGGSAYSNKFANASGGFQNIKDNIYTRALNAIYPTGQLTGVNQDFYKLNVDLNPVPISININNDILDGSIKYTYIYNNRPLSLVSGAIIEALGMEDSYSTRTYNLQNVFYRMALPQDIGTYSLPTRSVTYEATFPKPIYGTLPPNVKDQIDNLLKAFNPNKLSPSSSISANSPQYFSWLTANEETYDVIIGKYTKKYVWQYQKTYTPPGFA